MKKYLAATIVILLILRHETFSQSDNFSLSIKITWPDSSVVNLLLNTSDEATKRSLKVIKKDSQTYLAMGQLNYPTPATLEVNNRSSVIFFIDTGSQEVITRFDSLRFPILVRGSRTNQEYLHSFISYMRPYKALEDEWKQAYRKAYAKFDGEMPVLFRDSLFLQRKLHDKLRDSLLFKYIQSHPKSYVGFWMLNDFMSSYGFRKSYKEGFELLAMNIADTKDGKRLKKVIAAAQRTAIGNIFPNLELVDTLIKKRSLKTLLKSYTLIDFWYSNCSPCIAQFPALTNLYKQYKQAGFEVITISTDVLERERNWKNTIRTHNLPWIQLWDPGGVIAKQLSVEVFPTNFLLDESGRIVEKDIDLSTLSILLNKE